MRLKADLTLLLVAVIWGSAFVAQRVAGQLGSVYVFNGARYLLAALIVLPFARRDQPMLKLEGISTDQYRWMFVAGFLLFLGSALQQAGMVYTSAGNAGFITSLYVVLIPVFLYVFWGEQQQWISIAAVILAVSGAFLLSTAGVLMFQPGDLLELLGAAFWAFHVIVLGKFASRFSALTFSVGQLAVCGIVNMIPGLFYETGIQLSLKWLGAVIYTAVFSLGFCYTLQLWAQKHTPPADAALILSLESVFAVLFGWLLLGELLTGIQILGCLIILLAVMLVQVREWTTGKVDHDHLVEGR